MSYNVDVCISVHATKYIHKYIFKGHDRITVVVQQDEIKQYSETCLSVYPVLVNPLYVYWFRPEPSPFYVSKCITCLSL